MMTDLGSTLACIKCAWSNQLSLKKLCILMQHIWSNYVIFFSFLYKICGYILFNSLIDKIPSFFIYSSNRKLIMDLIIFNYWELPAGPCTCCIWWYCSINPILIMFKKVFENENTSDDMEPQFTWVNTIMAFKWRERTSQTRILMIFIKIFHAAEMVMDF